MNPDRWLTTKRLRAHGLLFAVTIWSFYIWTIATPGLKDRYGNLKGADFLHLYTIGVLASEHRGIDLYDINAQASLVVRRVPDAKGIRYLPLYPPQVSMLFAPLGQISYGRALAVWWMCSAAIYGACCYAIWKVCLRLRDSGWTVALLAAAYPAFFHLIAWGQTSAIALACFTGAYFLLRNQYNFAAGLILGCLVFKPPLGLALTILFVIVRAWRTVAGLAFSASAQLACGLLYYGWDPFRAWFQTLARIPFLMPSFEPRPYQTHCLRTFWSMLVPWDGLSFGLYAISAAVVMVWTVSIWKSREPLSLRYATLLLATVLVAPHLTVYDLVILAPAIVLLVEWLLSKPNAPNGIGILLYLVCVLPLVGPFTRWIHIQLSVVAMTAVLYLIWKTAISRLASRESLMGAKVAGG